MVQGDLEEHQLDLVGTVFNQIFMNNINLLVCTASSAKLSHLAVCSDHPPVRSRSEPEGKRKRASNHHEKHLANI